MKVETFTVLEEAANALAANAQARFVGGGTLLMREINEGVPSFECLIRCTDPATRDVVPQNESDGERLWLGAALTMQDILARAELSFLHAPARAVGGPAIRNMATLGGNLFAPSPYGDLTVALLALDGEAVIASASGAQSIPLETLLAARDQHPHPVVAGVSILKPRDAREVRFIKATRVKPKGISVLSMAAKIEVSGGQIKQACVAYGAMGPTPSRAVAVERALVGARVDEAGISAALSVAVDGFTPPTDAIASQWYRREVASVYLKRLLLDQ